ncbi:MAG: acetyl-CoA C-acetyltransferase [Burkholderiales bacterium]|nr:acetyl-CoA C-acetyltransferase [Burkholderiales bacterium]
MNEAYVFDSIRTPRGRGKEGGALHEVKPVSLVVQLMHALQGRHGFDTARVDDVVLGCVTPVGEQGACIAKKAALEAGWSFEAPGQQIHRFCGSGLEALNLAAQKVRSGWEDLVVAGGVESMSRVPMGSDGGEWHAPPGAEGDYVPQGISADVIATLHGFSREEVDRYAAESQARAAAARREGRFARSIVPIRDASGKVALDRDEHIREGTTAQALGALKPAFAAIGETGYDRIARGRYPQVERVDHVHTAGNSSGIVDGAALALVGSERAAKEHVLTPRARVVATALSGAEPVLMLTGPVPATRKALTKAGLRIEDIDLFEINEAFAVVPLYVMRELAIPHEKVNVNGGAIALGHPLGATGAILAGTLLDELERRRLRYGLATLCIGGGMGIATIFERI